MKNITVAAALSTIVGFLACFSATSCSSSPSISPAYPSNGSVVSLLQARPLAYVSKMQESKQDDAKEYSFSLTGGGDTKVRDYSSLILDLSKPANTDLVLSAGFEDADMSVAVSQTSDFKEAKTYPAADGKAVVNNLLSGTTYYWKAHSEKKNATSEVFSFKTEEGLRPIDAGDVLNVRDLGGRPTKSGHHVRQGVIYRGSEIIKEQIEVDGSANYATLDARAEEVFLGELGIKHEVDFRLDAEAVDKNGDPLKVSELGEEVSYERLTFMPYDGIFNKEQFPLLKAAILSVLQATPKEPLYFHCQAGADRTGTMAFILNGLLGVSLTDLLIDYEFTSFSKNTRLRNVSATYMKMPDLIQDFIDSRYNVSNNDIGACMENFLTAGLGIEKETVADFKKMMLV